MLKRINWQVKLGAVLLLLSASLYLLHYAIFKDAHHIFIYSLHELAFIPIEVLVVTLIIHRLLDKREKLAMLNKLNMIIGAFFSEAGTELLQYFSKADGNINELTPHFLFKNNWSPKDFNKELNRVKSYKPRIDKEQVDLRQIRVFLIEKRDFFLRLLENPILLEHETFTELLWAVFHLTEELERRKDVSNLEPADIEHVVLDIQRAYRLLVIEWITYMKHLSISYPYLYSLSVRTNPFDVNAQVEIKG